VKYVLDTNALSALMKGDEAFLSRLAEQDRTDVAVPQPVLAEIAYGLERLPRSKRRTELTRRFEHLRAELTRATWTDDVSDAFGTIKQTLERQGQRIEDFDVAIAAQALGHGAVLVTADRAHMARLKVEDWGAGGLSNGSLAAFAPQARA
jgi:tRNA(fMet)-specific endonuclease VapC